MGRFFINVKMAEKTEEQEQQQADPVFEDMIDLIMSRYEKARSVKDLTRLVTTEDIFDKMQEIYPSMFYSAATVARALHEKGFRMNIVGDLEFIWMIRPR